MSRRRGSAPIALHQVRSDENGPSIGSSLRPMDSATLRRGSMPAEVTHKSKFRFNLHKKKYQITWNFITNNFLRIEDENHGDRTSCMTPVEQPYNAWHYRRRGSAPTDLPHPNGTERRDQLTRHTSLNGKTGRRRKQSLNRRGSGGPEIVCKSETPTDTWSRFLLRRNETPDSLLARRRGSLPIEVLTVGHAGKLFLIILLR